MAAENSEDEILDLLQEAADSYNSKTGIQGTT
jgi:hypothetical protein